MTQWARNFPNGFKECKIYKIPHEYTLCRQVGTYICPYPKKKKNIFSSSIIHFLSSTSYRYRVQQTTIPTVPTESSWVGIPLL